MLQTLQECVKDPKDCERIDTRTWWDTPIILFVLEVTNERLPKDKYVDVYLRANVRRGARDQGTLVKKMYVKF